MRPCIPLVTVRRPTNSWRGPGETTTERLKNLKQSETSWKLPGSYEVIPSATVWWAQSEVCGIIYISSTPYNTSKKSFEFSGDYVHGETLSVGILPSSGTFIFQQVAAWGEKNSPHI
jgi:hypothetical protein